MDQRKLFRRLLDKQTVHVWTVRIQKSSAAVIADFHALLGPDERERACRFYFAHLRESFIVRRGVLRLLVGGYMAVAPADIEFMYGPNGKPSLPAPVRISFNMSHSGGIALIAFALDCELGIDVEQIRPTTDLEGIASQFFCAAEAAEILSRSGNQREVAFFHCWTRKEAYIKASGDGLSMPLDTFAVSVHPNERARLVHVAGNIQDARGWTLEDLGLSGQYAGAIAYRSEQRRLRMLPVVNAVDLLKAESHTATRHMLEKTVTAQ